jgi:hypothetical protein
VRQCRGAHLATAVDVTADAGLFVAGATAAATAERVLRSAPARRSQVERRKALQRVSQPELALDSRQN